MSFVKKFLVTNLKLADFFSSFELEVFFLNFLLMFFFFIEYIRREVILGKWAENFEKSNMFSFRFSPLSLSLSFNLCLSLSLLHPYILFLPDESWLLLSTVFHYTPSSYFSPFSIISFSFLLLFYIITPFLNHPLLLHVFFLYQININVCFLIFLFFWKSKLRCFPFCFLKSN